MRKTLLLSFAFLAVLGTLAASASATQETGTGPLLTQAPARFDDLVAAAKKEGRLTVIALPHDWVNYGEAISTFSKKYGITINELNPDGGSGDEIEAIKANKDNKGPQAPDVIDVGLSFGPDARATGLLAPYKVATWNTIPDSVKDADGYWYGDYYGALAFEVNLDVVKTPPLDWADLLTAPFKGRVALAGDPRTANQAIMTLVGAALANGGGPDNMKPGLDYFDKLFRQSKALNLQKEVTKTTNELLAKNSEMLKQGTIDIAKESERGIVEIETLQKVNTDLITTIEETLRIQDEGRAKRQQAEGELARMEGELKARLVTIKGA